MPEKPQGEEGRPTRPPIDPKSLDSNRRRYKEGWDVVTHALSGIDIQREHAVSMLRWLANEIDEREQLLTWEGEPVERRASQDPRHWKAQIRAEQRARFIAPIAEKWINRVRRIERLRAGVDALAGKPDSILELVESRMRDDDVTLGEITEAEKVRDSIGDRQNPGRLKQAVRERDSEIKRAEEEREINSIQDLAEIARDLAKDEGAGYLFTPAYGKKLLRNDLSRLLVESDPPAYRVYTGDLRGTVHNLVVWWDSVGRLDPMTEQEFREALKSHAP